MQGRFRGDVGLEAAHRAVLDLLGLLGHPLLALGRLRLRRGDAGRYREM